MSACKEFWTPVAFNNYGEEVAWLCSKCNTIHHSSNYYFAPREKKTFEELIDDMDYDTTEDILRGAQ